MMENKRKNLSGRVVSNKMSKTVVVVVESFGVHLEYKKAVMSIFNLKAQFEEGKKGHQAECGEELERPVGI